MAKNKKVPNRAPTKCLWSLRKVFPGISVSIFRQDNSNVNLYTCLSYKSIDKIYDMGNVQGLVVVLNSLQIVVKCLGFEKLKTKWYNKSLQNLLKLGCFVGQVYVKM